MGNSLSQNLSVLPAPSGREPLARPQTLHFSRELCRYVKGPISEGAVERSETGKFRKEPPQALRASSPKGTPLRYAGNFTATTQSRPLGEGGIAAGDDGRGNFPTAPAG